MDKKKKLFSEITIFTLISAAVQSTVGFFVYQGWVILWNKFKKTKADTGEDISEKDEIKKQ